MERMIDLASQVQTKIETSMQVDDVDMVTTEVRQRSSHTGLYRNYLIRMGKAKFGTPECNAANRMAIRKYLYDICREDSVRPRHINEHLDIAVAMVMVPTETEIVAAAIAHTASTQAKCSLMKGLRGATPNIA
ncbi:hypothetical protein [Freshwater macrophyte associated tombus-like virus 3]|nr:hypothetical protein [Freshwater macrophyte associated tombus-like virus 3]